MEKQDGVAKSYRKVSKGVKPQSVNGDHVGAVPRDTSTSLVWYQERPSRSLTSSPCPASLMGDNKGRGGKLDCHQNRKEPRWCPPSLSEVMSGKIQWDPESHNNTPNVPISTEKSLTIPRSQKNLKWEKINRQSVLGWQRG